MDVKDVIPAQAQRLSHLPADGSADGDACLRLVEVDRLAPADPDHVRLPDGAGQIGRDDVDVMPSGPRFTRKEMHVLANATEVRVVVLRDDTDAKALAGIEGWKSLQMSDDWSPRDYCGSSRAACAAARRAMGTRNGEHDT